MSTYRLEVETSAMGAVATEIVAEDAPTIDVGRLGFELKPPLPFVLKDGPFANQSVYEVIERAIDYWESYLSAIERDISSQPQNLGD